MLDQEEIPNFMSFILSNAGYRLIHGDYNGRFFFDEDSSKLKYQNTEIRGIVRSEENVKRIARFEFEVYTGEERGGFSGLNFFTIPGYDLEEHDSEEVEAWRELGKSVEKYFNGRLEQK